MISVIICSINEQLCEQVIKNIDATIGVAWEPVIKNNVQEQKSITQVYNAAASLARYKILCFVHEDVLFKTQDWGKKIIGAFEQDEQLGLVGIGGAKYKSELPSGWFTGLQQVDCCNIEHLDNKGNITNLYFNPDREKKLQEVVVIDGVFMCCPKIVWENIRFDEKVLTGFHLYDIDFSFRAAQAYKVAVTYEIDMVHFTEGGNYGNAWMQYTLAWHKKFDKQLPFFTRDIAPVKQLFNKIIVRNWLIRLKHESISLKNKWSWITANALWKHPYAWPNLPMFFLKQLIKSSKR